MSEISEACGGGDAGRPLVPGSLRGYRTWRPTRWRAPVPHGALPLTSVTRRRVVWTPTLTARCTPRDDGPQDPAPVALPDDHRAPQSGCDCGIYAWYEPADTRILHARVFGVVEASGLILMGDHGFRAERVRIAAVVTRKRRVAAACEEAGIPVYRRRRDLLRDHPPQDLSALLGDRSSSTDLLPPGAGTAFGGPPAHGFDQAVFLAVWARTALIALALIALPTVGAVATAVGAQLVLMILIATRLR
jgi:hypothetical protein